MDLRPRLHPRPVRTDIAIVAAAGTLLIGWACADLAGLGSVAHRPTVPDGHVRPIAQSIPTAPLPAVEPKVYAAVTADTARVSNDAVPIVQGPIAAARPFVFAGTVSDRAIAKTCLAAAILYEAGDDAEGERAVAQVVLNRLRHPAFPKTVCGVIFQGADRGVGCQFTFACDGAINRPPNPMAWKRATLIADAALAGSVYKPVGTATHYHTDWVVPRWRDALDKIAVVHTQIFYRWRGPWGQPSAFVGTPQAPEQLDPRLVALAGPMPLSIDPAALADSSTAPGSSLAVQGVPAAAIKGGVVRLKDDARAQYVVQLDTKTAPGAYAVTGYTICADKPDCIMYGWTSAAEMPRALPIYTAQMQGLAFMYRKSAGDAAAVMQWNCRLTPRADPAQCLPGSAPPIALSTPPR